MNRPITLFDHVARHALATPQALALRGAAGVSTYSELLQDAQRLAAALASIGIARGDIVAVQLPNTAEFVITLLALNALGATVQMVHMPYRKAELSFLLGHSSAKAYVGMSNFRHESPAALALEVSNDSLDQVFESSTDATTGAMAAATPSNLRVVIALGAKVEGASIEPLEVVATDVLLSAAPFTHLYGLFVLELALLAGASLALLPTFTPTELVESVVRDQVSAIFAGPAHFKPLLDQDSMRRQDFARVRFVCLSGTAVPPELARQVEAHLQAGVVPVLGERACAFVKSNGQAEVRLADLTAALARAGVAKFKWPEHLIFVDDWPLTPTQKVMRNRLSKAHFSSPQSELRTQ